MKLTLCLSILTIALPLSLSAEIDKEIQWGVEGVTGYRSNYVYRGFKLSKDTLDFQLETEISLSNTFSLNIGGWYATETGKGNYDEEAGFLKLHYQASHFLTLGTSATYRSFNQSFFIDGVDLGFFATWKIFPDIEVTLGANYDTGAEGWYGNLETNWSHVISDKSFISLQTGISAVDHYYSRNGFNDVYGRLSFTYNISDSVSVTPYIGGSALLDDKDSGKDTAFAGIWFEVRF